MPRLQNAKYTAAQKNGRGVLPVKPHIQFPILGQWRAPWTTLVRDRHVRFEAGRPQWSLISPCRAAKRLAVARLDAPILV
jgi:hypothetical protein